MIGIIASSCRPPTSTLTPSSIRKLEAPKEKIINKRIPKYILLNPINAGNLFPLSSGRLFEVMHLTFVSWLTPFNGLWPINDVFISLTPYILYQI